MSLYKIRIRKNYFNAMVSSCRRNSKEWHFSNIDLQWHDGKGQVDILSIVLKIKLNWSKLFFGGGE